MLTIKNYNKLYKKDVGEWRVGKIIEERTYYQITLFKRNRRKTISVNIERTPIQKDVFDVYELWYWKGKSMVSAIAERTLLPKSEYRDMDTFIKNLNELISK